MDRLINIPSTKVTSNFVVLPLHNLINYCRITSAVYYQLLSLMINVFTFDIVTLINRNDLSIHYQNQA